MTLFPGPLKRPCQKNFISIQITTLTLLTYICVCIILLAIVHHQQRDSLKTAKTLNRVRRPLEAFKRRAILSLLRDVSRGISFPLQRHCSEQNTAGEKDINIRFESTKCHRCNCKKQKKYFGNL